DYGIELVGGNTSAALTGLTLAVSAVGRVDKSCVALRNGATEGDLVCLSGSLGAAFLGLKLLEREKRALEGNSGVQPELKGYEYVLGKQLFPRAPKVVVEALEAAEVVPSSMIDITKGLASAALNICNSSEVGIRLMLDRIPIAKDCFRVAQEFNIDPVVAALNGGDDYELMFTVPASMHKDVLAMCEVIGYITPESEGANMITPDGSVIRILSPDFTATDDSQQQ
ncbi:MAG: thiamine-phosphate kinase, partial [Rikenellaceae bacterium]